MNKKKEGKGMIGNISSQQNSPDNLRLLAAQRHLYTRAKVLRRLHMILVVGLAVIALIVFVLRLDSKYANPIMASIGFAAVVSRFIIGDIGTKKVKQAATVQEQFDVDLFGLSWSTMLVGDRLEPELVSAANRDFKGDKEKLRDWYAKTDDIPYPLDVLLCQRANLVWDWRLHYRYGVTIAVVTIVVCAIGITIALLTKQTMANYFLRLLIPSLPVYIHGTEVATRHLRLASEKELFYKRISRLWESLLEDPSAISREECRDIQNCIFIQRSKGILVPDLWYKRLWSKYESDMQRAIKDLRARVSK